MSTDITYTEVTKSKAEPDAMMSPAWVMRDLGLDIPASIPDTQYLIMTSAGWEVMQ